MASGSGSSKGKSRVKTSTAAKKRGKKNQGGPKWVADKGGRTGHWEGGDIYDDLPF